MESKIQSSQLQNDKLVFDLFKEKNLHFKFLTLIQAQDFKEATKVAKEILKKEPENKIIKKFYDFLNVAGEDLPYINDVAKDSDEEEDSDYEYYEEGDEKEGKKQQQKKQEEEEEEEDEDDDEYEYTDGEDEDDEYEYYTDEEEDENASVTTGIKSTVSK